MTKGDSSEGKQEKKMPVSFLVKNLIVRWHFLIKLVSFQCTIGSYCMSSSQLEQYIYGQKHWQNDKEVIYL